MSARKQRLLISLIAYCPALFSEIVIDGLLNEEEWTSAKEINEFYEKTLFYLIENSTDYEKKYIQDFEERIINNWF